MQIVWFKRDLRVRDHRPLVEAAARGPVLCLYVYEPELLDSTELGALHYTFIHQSLVELREDLRRLGADLVVRFGSMPEVLETLHREQPITALYSHRETGNRITYDRDLRVAGWAAARGIPWQQWGQSGVIRRMKTRDGWARRWARIMSRPILDPPDALCGHPEVASEDLRSPSELGLPGATQVEVQRGGEREARSVLDSFLQERGARYRLEMSSPVSAGSSCSRLSPYLAWGNISVKTVYQRARERSEEVKALKKDKAPIDPSWPQSLSSFQSRLRWHCHFMQKLEDEPEIEFHAMNRALDGLRVDSFRQDYFDAWANGQTGYPIVDACMRALHRTGWINFRMRAMLMSFASYHLWLDWRPTSRHLAQCFLDFEPGIHFSQAQMQSGTTGINAVRIYSPIKQVIDQDPEGIFIKRYVPELEAVPAEHIAEPQKMPGDLQRRLGCIIGRDYPAPIVDHPTAYKEARRRIYAARKGTEARQESERVYQKHVSRRRPRQ